MPEEMLGLTLPQGSLLKERQGQVHPGCNSLGCFLLALQSLVEFGALGIFSSL